MGEPLDYVFHNGGFVVLADQDTVLTIRTDRQSDSNFLYKQRLRDKSGSKLFAVDKDFFIETLRIDQQTNSIFLTGSMSTDDKSRVLQYDLASGELLKSFQVAGADIVMEAVCANRLCFLGCNNSLLEVMDLDRVQMVGDSLATAVGIIFSVEICRVAPTGSDSPRFVLALGGKLNDYSGGRTDLFDVSELLATAPSPPEAQLRRKDLEIYRLRCRLAKQARDHKDELGQLGRQKLKMIQLKVTRER